MVRAGIGGEPDSAFPYPGHSAEHVAFLGQIASFAAAPFLVGRGSRVSSMYDQGLRRLLTKNEITPMSAPSRFCSVTPR
jgi:hypothetical protein